MIAPRTISRLTVGTCVVGGLAVNVLVLSWLLFQGPDEYLCALHGKDGSMQHAQAQEAPCQPPFSPIP